MLARSRVRLAPFVSAWNVAISIVLLAGIIACSNVDPVAPEIGSGDKASSAGVISYERFVDAANGDDSSGDGLTPSTAYRTIGRALADVPSTVSRNWTIHLAPGKYQEVVRVQRFVMPSALSYEQLLGPLDSVTYIAIKGPPQPDTATIVASEANLPCLSATGAILFLESLTCRSQGRDGVVVSGGTLVMDDVRIIASDSSRSGISIDRSVLYLGGTLLVEGPFAKGLSIRNFSLARSKTHLHPNSLVATFKGSNQGIFLRDDGALSMFGGADTVRFEGLNTAIYALFGSTAFFGAKAVVEGSNLQFGFSANHQSGINSHRTIFRHLRSAVARCNKQSYVLIEQGTYEDVNMSTDSDGTCQIRT
jgi:hypothetical protein